LPEDEKPKYSTNTANGFSNSNNNESSYNSRNSFSGTKSRFEFTSAPPTNSYSYNKPTNNTSYQYPQYQYTNNYSGSFGTQPNPPTVGAEKTTTSLSSCKLGNKLLTRLANQNGTINGSSNTQSQSNGALNGTHQDNSSSKTSNSGTTPVNNNAYDMLKFFNYNLMFPPPVMAPPTTNGTSQPSYTPQMYQPMNWYYLNQLQNTSTQANSSQNTQNLGVASTTEKPSEGEKKTQ
jgi:hypothetical protein